MDTLISESTNDACIIQFDFTCPPETASFTPQVNFNYVFASEEYDEFVDAFNDVFGFFLNGVNIAIVPNTDPPVPVSINTVNVEDNSQFFVENDGNVVPEYPYNHEADGHTTVLRAVAAPRQGVNTIKIAIADTGDSALDSWVLLEAGSFSCVQPIETPSPTAVPSQSSQPSKEPSSQPSVSVAPSSSKQPSYPPTSSPIQIPQQTEATCQEHLTDSLTSLYSYLKSVNWWREWRTALKASWAKTYIWWAVKKDNCNYKLGKANRALGKLGCPVNDASPFSEICGQITMAKSCLEAVCSGQARTSRQDTLFNRNLRG